MDDSWIWRGHPSYVWRYGQDRRLALIQRHVQLEGRRILDVGCGIGTYVEKLAHFSSEVYGVDVDEKRVQAGRERGSSLVAGSAEELPFRDNAIDVILLNEVIEHVGDDQQALNETLRVLRPGGEVVIFAPNRLYPFETHGAYFGGRFVFRLIPLINYLPDFLRNRFCPHVRAYYQRDIKRLLKGLSATVVLHSYVYPGFDNIYHRSPALAKTLRAIFYGLESTPLRRFGLSHFVIVRKASLSELDSDPVQVQSSPKAGHGT